MKLTKIKSCQELHDFDIEGLGDIRRAKIRVDAKKGDIFNIYRGESTKEGCEFLGGLEESLLEHFKAFPKP